MFTLTLVLAVLSVSNIAAALPTSLPVRADSVPAAANRGVLFCTDANFAGRCVSAFAASVLPVICELIG
jgi:hypothetical protein